MSAVLSLRVGVSNAYTALLSSFYWLTAACRMRVCSSKRALLTGFIGLNNVHVRSYEFLLLYDLFLLCITCMKLL